MAVRTQIALEAQDHRRAKRRAAEMGVSLAEYVRRLVSRDLGEPSRGAEVSTLFDLFDGGRTDIGRDKDRLLAEAFEADQARSRGDAQRSTA